MTSLFRSIVSNKQRDIHFKNEIIKELNNYIKEIQLQPPRTVGKQTTNEVTIALCTTLEALFLHGLKDTIFSKVSAIASDIIDKPNCNFWSVALIFSHHEIISSIDQLKMIRNDIGRCRAWLRIAINDNLLVSYLSMMTAEPKSLVPFYNKTALLRDAEKLGIAMSLLTGIMPYEFDIVVNSSLLNEWPDDALVLAGTWSPPMKANPISSGMDVVQTIKDDIEESLGSKLSVSSFASEISTHKYPDKTEEEIWNILTPPSTSVPTNEVKHANSPTVPITNKVSGDTIDICSLEPEQHIQNKEKTINQLKTVTPEISITEGTHDKIEDKIIPQPVGQSDESKTEEKVPCKTSLEAKPSYKGVVERYRKKNSKSIEDIENGCDIDALLRRFQVITESQTSKEAKPSTPKPLISSDPEALTPEEQDFDFEIVDASQLPLDLPEFSHFAECLPVLTREKGVRSQKYSCKQCSTPIGINFTSLCHFTSEYFCEDCFDAKTSAIPARIIYNWDFAPRPVSGKAFVFLSEIHNHPLFNIKILNPRLYLVVEQMTQVQYMRMRLGHIKGYLLSCRSTVNYLHVELWPREYLYESLHIYSVQDFKEIQSGKLQTLLQHVIAYGVKHIASCDVCTLKGHICELCPASQDIIFPFDLDKTHTCRACRAVYHKGCYRGECPKCVRIRRRQSMLDVKDSDDVEDSGGEIEVEERSESGREMEIQNRRYIKDKINDGAKIPNGILEVGSPICDMRSDTDDSVSIDGGSPVQIECIAEVHSIESS